MKKLIYITMTLLSVWSCARFDDSKIWEEFDNYYERLEKLEAACDVMNSNISALQAIVTALQGNDYVTGVAEIVEDGEVVGYTITFSKSGVVKIYHGEDGADGEDGAPGADGRPGADGAAGSDGVDGENGHSPVVGVRKDADGGYYWTIDGEWMLDAEGHKVPATGKDGEDAEEGADGKDGVTPLLKIEDGYWFVSYDGGVNWTKLYKAVGENGADGTDGAPGAPGQDGKEGQSFFQGVDTSSSEDYIILTLADGTQIKLPTWKAFEELQTMVNKLNTNVSALQAIVEALENNDYVTEINPIIDNGKEIGYTILFAKSQSITIYHGKDGADGSDGAPGQNGEDGKDGKDGYTPVLGVKPADDDWSLDNDWDADSEGQTRYYWTLDGEWLLDSEGNRIPASGVNGNDGSNGTNGQNGITPKLKIVDEYWYVSLDGGQTWQPEPLGPATAGAGESIFSDITYTTSYLHITLADGKVITLSRDNDEISDYCVIDEFIIEGRKASFTGHINVEKEDIQYCKVSIYYSAEDEFNIHTAKVASTISFDYNNSFTIYCSGLEYDATYKYCICLDIRSQVLYSPVSEFTTESGEESEEVVKDLFTTIPIVTRQDTEIAGVTFTWDGDVCTVSGTSTGYAFTNMIVMEPLEAPLTPGKAYRLDLNQTDPNIIMSVFQKIDGISHQTRITKDGGFIIAKNASRIVIRVEVLNGMTANGTISPKLYAVPDEDADIFTLSSVTTREDKTQNGVTFIWNGDVCSVLGTATGYAFTNMIIMEPLESPLLPGQTYNLRLNNTDENIIMSVFQTIDDTSQQTMITKDDTFTIDKNTTRIVIRVEVLNGKTANGTIRPELYLD